MQTVDIVLIALGVLLVIVGYARGFGKALRGMTKGVFGIIISVFVCAAFGGMILGTDFVGGYVLQLNALLAEKWAFLGKIQAGVIVYYAALFFVAQILRIIIVKLVCGIFEANNKVVRVINRVLGTVFLPAAGFIFLLLVLAVVRLFDNTDTVINLLAKFNGSILVGLYEINPIILHL